MPTRKKRHGGHDEEHESHERWLITYADMLTLLMVLFIVLFAMSQVDKKKFAELAQGLASGFGAKSVRSTRRARSWTAGAATRRYCR